MAKTILLTGATGFLGSHLLKKLLDNGFNVIILKRSFSKIDNISELINKIKFYDIDKTDISVAFEENKIDTIIHAATDYGRNSSISKLLNSNLIFPVELLELAIEHKVKYFINTDTFYSKNDTNYSHLSSYTISKRSLQIWLKYFSQNIHIINMVLEHIYGENDNDTKFVTQIIKKIALEKVQKIDLTLGEQKRDFIYIDDVTNAYICVLNNLSKIKNNYTTFDIGTGKNISIKDFVTAIKNISNCKTILNFGVIPYRNGEIMDAKADTKNINALGWHSQYSYEQGILATITKEKSNVQ